MRTWSLIVPPAVVAVLLAACLGVSARVEKEQRMAGDGQEAEMRVYLMLFDSLTYGPVTVNDIEASSDYAVALSKKHPLIDRMYRRLKSRPGTHPPAGEFIRMKVGFRKGNREEIFYADMGGNVAEWGSGNLFSLTKDEMKKIEEEISYLEGVVDLKPESNMSDLRRVPQIPEGR